MIDGWSCALICERTVARIRASFVLSSVGLGGCFVVAYNKIVVSCKREASFNSIRMKRPRSTVRLADVYFQILLCLCVCVGGWFIAHYNVEFLCWICLFLGEFSLPAPLETAVVKFEILYSQRDRGFSEWFYAQAIHMRLKIQFLNTILTFKIKSIFVSHGFCEFCVVVFKMKNYVTTLLCPSENKIIRNEQLLSSTPCRFQSSEG